MTIPPYPDEAQNSALFQSGLLRGLISVSSSLCFRRQLFRALAVNFYFRYLLRLVLWFSLV